MSSDSEAMVEGIRSEQRSKRGHDRSHNIANVRSFDSGHSRSIPEPRSFRTEFPTTSSNSESMIEGIQSEQRLKKGHDGSYDTANFEDRIHQLKMAMKEEVQAVENRITLKFSMIHDDIRAKFAGVPRTTNGFEATCDAYSF
ncbi:hypothetical protein QYF36_000613 [Acer negundo]|nr:hypothetical protein QYF36_000613 [Acer negundo]